VVPPIITVFAAVGGEISRKIRARVRDGIAVRYAVGMCCRGQDATNKGRAQGLAALVKNHDDFGFCYPSASLFIPLFLGERGRIGKKSCFLKIFHLLEDLPLDVGLAGSFTRRRQARL
jgi:hypothetical protein